MEYSEYRNANRRAALEAEANRILKSGMVCVQAGAKHEKKKKTFSVTTEWIKQNATPAGGYKAEQLRLIGIRYPLRAGWMLAAGGLEITKEAREKFESFHHGYKATKKSKSVLASHARNTQSFGTTTSEVEGCGCDVLPWEDCEHTDRAADNAMREMVG